MTPEHPTDLLHRLATQLHGEVTAGASFDGELQSGNLVAEVSVRIRRRVSAEDTHEFGAAAIEELRRHPYRVQHCNCEVVCRSRGWGPRTKLCGGRVVAVVVYRGEFHPLDAPCFQFVCGKHRSHPRLVPKAVFATLSLPEPLLAPIRRQAEIDREAWRARCEAEDERERAESASGRTA